MSDPIGKLCGVGYYTALTNFANYRRYRQNFLTTNASLTVRDPVRINPAAP